MFCECTHHMTCPSQGPLNPTLIPRYDNETVSTKSCLMLNVDDQVTLRSLVKKAQLTSSKGHPWQEWRVANCYMNHRVEHVQYPCHGFINILENSQEHPQIMLTFRHKRSLDDEVFRDTKLTEELPKRATSLQRKKREVFDK